SGPLAAAVAPHGQNARRVPAFERQVLDVSVFVHRSASQKYCHAHASCTKRSFDTLPAPMPRAAIIAGLRTPFVRAGTDFAQLNVLELARSVTVDLLQRLDLDPREVHHVIYGNVTRPVQYSNLARELVLAAGLPRSTPADTVSVACASACQAITDAANLIERGYADVVIAGGVEMLSNVPIALSPPLARALVAASQAKSIPARLQSFRSLGLADLAPQTPSIAETSTGLSMG